MKQPDHSGRHRELSVVELLRRAKPFPPIAEMAIGDLSAEEAEEFLAAVRS